MQSVRLVVPLRYAALCGICLLLVGSCSGSDEERIKAAALAEGCSLNSQCNVPLVCTFERCHTQCNQDRDCPGEQRCVSGDKGYVCQLKVETDCTKNAKVCQGGQVCGVDGECRDPCKSADDCTTGQTCALSGECASSDPTKDLMDASGNILPDPFVDPADGSTSSHGGGGSSTTAAGGSTGGTTSTSSNSVDVGGVGGINTVPSSVAGAGNVGPSSSSVPTTGGAAAGGASVTGQGGVTTSGGTTAASGGVSLVGGFSSTSATSGPSTGGSSVGGVGGAGGVGPLSCPPNKADCDTNPSDCETDLTQVTSCGSCTTVCNPNHGVVLCDAVTLKCVVNAEAGGCTTGYGDCNTDGRDGCEVTFATDPNNCGRCGRSCGGATCTSGSCGGAIVFAPSGATSISYSQTGFAALIGSQLVKQNTSTGKEIRTASLPPSDPISQGVVLATAATSITAMHADAANVYYAIQGSPATILFKPLTASESTAAKIAVNMPDNFPARLITSNGTAFYIVSTDNNGKYRLLTAAKTLGSASSASVLAGLDGRNTIGALAVAGSFVFWSEGSSVYAGPLGGGTPIQIDSTLGTSGYNNMAFAVDAGYLYWNTANGSSSRIRRLPISGTTVASTDVQDVTVGISAPDEGLAVDDMHVYYCSDWQVFRVAKDGNTAPELLGNLNVAPRFYYLFAVDSGFVYGTGANGQIVRLAKTPI